MSAVSKTESITASLAGITVEKSFELDRLPVPAVGYRISSERSAAAEVRLVEGVPGGVDPNDIGFKSSLDGDHWHRGGGELVWRGTVEPGEDVVTCIGVRTDDPTEVYRFHGRPQIAAVDPAEGRSASSAAEREEPTSGEAGHRKTTAPRGTDRPSPGEWQRAVTGPEEPAPHEVTDFDEASGGDERSGATASRGLSGHATTLLRAGAKVALVLTLIGGAAML